MPSWTNATPSTEGAPPPTGTGAGVLHPADVASAATLVRRAAPPELAHWIEHLWSVQWSLPEGRVQRSEVLTHPAVHLTVEWGPGPRHGAALPAALVHGVVTRVFSVDLSGEGGVAGVRFRPGGYTAFTSWAAADVTDRVIGLDSLYGAPAEQLAAAVVATADVDARLDELTRFLTARTPAEDPTYDELLAVVATMLEDRSLTTVEAVAREAGVSVRSLQRRFRRYVGVGPKWVLQRYRLQDAVAAIDAGEVDDLATLAAELGWYDQAHFSRDFTEVVGMPPGRYLAHAAAAD